MAQVASDHRMLCVDLDETLLVDFHVPYENQEAIKKMVKQGYMLTIASGRPFFLIDDILKEIALENRKDQYTIALNGATIYRNDGELLYKHPLSFEQVCYLYELSLKYHTGFSFFSSEHLYLINPIESEITRRKSQKAVYSIVSDLKDFADMTIYKSLLVLDDSQRLRMIAQENIEGLKKMGIEFSFSSNRYLECNDTGVNKGAAIRWLSDYLGLGLDEIVAIGDNSNDVTMLETAGLGVAVANATDDAKASADLCLSWRFDKMAVAKFIEDHFLG